MFGSSQWMYNSGSEYTIEQSLRFDEASNTYLYRTPTTQGNRKTWTFSTWFKRSGIGTNDTLFTAEPVGSKRFAIYTLDTQLYIDTYDGNTGLYYVFDDESPSRFRDPSAWYHLVVSVDTDNDNQDDRLIAYLNGARLPIRNTLPKGYELAVNATTFHGVGVRHDGSNIHRNLDGYMADTYFIDGQALDADYFGEINEDYGHWVAKEFKVANTPKGSYGTNGFYLDFASNKAQYDATDLSGNGYLSVSGTVSTVTSTSPYTNWTSYQTHNATITASSSASYTGSNDRTFEFWMRETAGSWSNRSIFYGYSSDWYNPFIGIDGDGKLWFGNQNSGGSNLYYHRASIVPTRGNWNHYAVTISNKTVTLWINGQNAGSHTYTTGTWSTINNWNFLTHNDDSGLYWQDVRVSDNIRYSSTFSVPTEVLQNDSNTLILYQSGSSTAEGTIGNDASGTGNHYTTNNLLGSDVVPDSPNNNFATINPLDGLNSPTLSEGNLKYYSNVLGVRRSTLGFKDQKQYFEICQVSGVTPGTPFIYGICELEGAPTHTTYKQGLAIYNDNGNGHSLWSIVNGSIVQNDTGYFSTTSAGDVWMIAYDGDTGKCWVGRNGTWFNSGNPAAGTGFIYQFSGDYTMAPVMDHAGANYTAVLNTGQDSSFAGTKTAQGNTDGNGIGDFYYAPPSGFLALCTANLPEPAVKPQENFNTVLYAGTGSAGHQIDVGFATDFVWLKDRFDSDVHQLMDKVRGGNRTLQSNETNAEYVDANLISFNSTGFEILNGYGNYNRKGDSYVTWNWKAGGTSVTNTDGTITSAVSANPDAGFSIASYTGTGSNEDVGHGLSQAPEMVIVKNRSNVESWLTWHKGLAGGDYYVYLHSSQQQYNNNSKFRDVPTSSVFKVGFDGSSGASGNAYIAYCFHSVDGFSKFGSYTGNSSSDGPFVYTGFRPAFVITKKINGAGNWRMNDSARDPFNVVDLGLNANETQVEFTQNTADFLSNGFKIRDSAGANDSGDTYIYMAFAEYPFKYSNARGTSYDKETGVAPSTNTINQSLRFNDDDSAYLSRTPSAAGNRKTWTWSGWVKRGNLGASNAMLFGSGDTYISYNNDNLSVNLRPSGTNYFAITSAFYRDVSAWYHIVVAVDTTQAAGTDRLKMYVNGVKQTSFILSSYTSIPINTDTSVNRASEHNIAKYTSGGLYHDGYMAEVNFIDGQALGPEHFGYSDPTYGDWRPKVYDDKNPAPDYGPNGFYLKFASGAVGTDSSPMGNNWTLNNISATTDVVLDSPTNNFATWNPLANGESGKATLSDGNLTAKYNNVSGSCALLATHAASSGKYYWEVEVVSLSTSSRTSIGVADYSTVNIENDIQTQDAVHYSTGEYNRLWDFGTEYDGVYTSVSAGDIFQVAIDTDTGKIWFGLNGTWLSGNPATDTSPIATRSGDRLWGPVSMLSAGLNITQTHKLNTGQDSSFGGNKTAQGNQDSNGEGDFYYTPPTGFLALCNNNLPNPTVVPKENFNTVLWTGTGSQPRSITGVGFQPDFAWMKARDSAYYHQTYDSVRGTGSATLYTNTTDDEDAPYYLQSFDSDGVTLGSNLINVNRSGEGNVGWFWKAGGSGVTNTDGSITSTVSANTDAGFSIVSYTGAGIGTNSTVGHGLSQAPDFIVVKDRDSASRGWIVYHSSLGASSKLALESTDAIVSSSAYWTGTEPTSTVFGVGTGGDTNTTDDFIAYCFHDVDGFSKFGSYTGNGQSWPNSPFVYTGFRPAFVMIKRTDSADVWVIHDSKRDGYNYNNDQLYPNLSNAENDAQADGGYNNLLSNGFKLNNGAYDKNASGGTYIYAAFAEYPFKRTNSR
jgi:hypothetical protein